MESLPNTWTWTGMIRAHHFQPNMPGIELLPCGRMVGGEKESATSLLILNRIELLPHGAGGGRAGKFWWPVPPGETPSPWPWSYGGRELYLLSSTCLCRASITVTWEGEKVSHGSSVADSFCSYQGLVGCLENVFLHSLYDFRTSSRDLKFFFRILFTSYYLLGRESTELLTFLI